MNFPLQINDTNFNLHNKTLNSSSGSSSATVVAKPPTPTMMHHQSSPIPNANSINPVEVENLKKQLKSSEMTITELKTMVERLAMENSMLKTRIDSQIIPNDVQL